MMFSNGKSNNGRALLADGTDIAVETLDVLQITYSSIQQKIEEMKRGGCYPQFEDVRRNVKKSVTTAEGITAKYAADGIFDKANEVLEKYQALDEELDKIEAAQKNNGDRKATGAQQSQSDSQSQSSDPSSSPR